MRILEKIEPKEVFRYFEDISSIPHGSGNTDKISEYCVNFAKSHGLEYIKDELNNVIIKKPASDGYENHPTVILQGHLDMVCEKEKGSSFDFLNDALALKIDGDMLLADGTTLGADDGIAVAMVLSVLADKTLKHPKIEAVFTVDEETGMYGVHALDEALIEGKTLINIDSGREDIFTIGCAGGARAEIKLILDKEEEIYNRLKKITVGGLKGGHSGNEINKGRLNADIVLGRFLKTIKGNFRIVGISGGLKDNVIPRHAECVIAEVDNCTFDVNAFLEKEALDTDSGLSLKIENLNDSASAFNKESTLKIIELLNNIPNGIIAMSKDIDGLVETSLNLGILKIDGDLLTASFAVRSAVNSERNLLLEKLKNFAEKRGYGFCEEGHYSAWEVRKNSKIREVMCSTYEKLYGKKPIVKAVHAGLECGVLSGKISDLDAISIGPDMYDIHTPRERLSLSSTKRCYDFLCETLKNI